MCLFHFTTSPLKCTQKKKLPNTNSYYVFLNQTKAGNHGLFSDLFSLLAWMLLFLLLAVLALFAAQRVQANKGFPIDVTLLNDFQEFVKSDIATPVYTQSLALSARTWNGASKLLGESEVRLKTGLGSFKEALQRNLVSARVFLGSQWEIYWPHACELSHSVYVELVQRGKEVYQVVRDALDKTASIVNTVEYKLPTFMHHVSEGSEERKEIVKDYELLKEKIFNEAKQMLVNSLPTNDIETMRRELDQKFNYTLSIMSNKLVDQSMQLEISQANHGKQLEQMKTVLVELGKFLFVLNKEL